VAWSHDATRLASASLDHTVRIWDPATGQCVSTLEGHSGWVRSVAWSHDATRLASASVDHTVRIWDPATGQCVSTLEGHSRWVRSVAWSHNATRLAASYDKTVKIWDSATGRCVSTLNIQVYNLQFHESNSNFLHTNLGTFDLQTAAIATVFGLAPTDRSSPIAVGYGLSSNRAWIMYQGENLLWLPSEYRPSSSAISGTVVSIGCSSGRILLFTFADGNPISQQVS
jgi:WD40 repeat protein